MLRGRSHWLLSAGGERASHLGKHPKLRGQTRDPDSPSNASCRRKQLRKTTFLAVVSCVFNMARFPSNPGFNEPPYNLGTFDTIATFKGGKYGRAPEFSMGFETDESEEEGAWNVVASYRSDLGNTVWTSIEIATRTDSLRAKFQETKSQGNLPWTGRKKNRLIFKDMPSTSASLHLPVRPWTPARSRTKKVLRFCFRV